MKTPKKRPYRQKPKFNSFSELPIPRKVNSPCLKPDKEDKGKIVLRVAVPNRKSANDKVDDKQEHCSGYIIRVLQGTDYALGYLGFGSAFTYGTLRNNMKKLVDGGKVLKLPKECPARFILSEWAHRPEYSCIVRNDKKGRAGRFDFLSYLESLRWSPVLGVHDLRLSFSVYQFHWMGAGWKYCKNSHSYSRCFHLSYPVHVQCYDTGVVLVSIQCSSKPFSLDIDGLVALSNLLGEVRACLNSPAITEPYTWLISQWHLNRDSEQLEGSPGTYLTFRDFFDDSARFYYKHNLKKYRAEVAQNPKRTVKEIFEIILNRDEILPKRNRGEALSG